MNPRWFSRPVLSTTQPPLRNRYCNRIYCCISHYRVGLQNTSLYFAVRASAKKRRCSKSFLTILSNPRWAMNPRWFSRPVLYSGRPALHPSGASLRLFKIVPDDFVDHSATSPAGDKDNHSCDSKPPLEQGFIPVNFLVNLRSYKAV